MPTFEMPWKIEKILGMHKPPHPGVVLKELYIKPSKLSQKEIAKKIGISQTSLSDVISGKKRISIKTAHGLALTFGLTAKTWLDLQLQYDIWVYRKKIKSKDGSLDSPS